jgi:hypothetical protein
MAGKRKPAGTVFIEYALLIGAIVLIAVLAYSVLGHKTNDVVASAAAILPGAHEEDDLTFVSGEIIEHTHNGGDATVDTSDIGGANSERLGDNIGVPGASNIVK